MSYKSELTDAMTSLAVDYNFVFIGQGVEFGGHGMAPTIENVPIENRVEMPVFEETQTGLALGMALSGTRVVSLYPRFDFFISGANQLINHADKIKQMSNGAFCPHLIYRVGVGSKIPIDAGPQHTNNYAKQFSEMLTDINVVELLPGTNVKETVMDLATAPAIHLLVEHYQYYGS